jgi:hypothetical protein
MAIDDATLLTYAEDLPDMKKGSKRGFLIRPVGWLGRDKGFEWGRVL